MHDLGAERVFVDIFRFAYVMTDANTAVFGEMLSGNGEDIVLVGRAGDHDGVEPHLHIGLFIGRNILVNDSIAVEHVVFERLQRLLIIRIFRIMLMKLGDQTVVHAEPLKHVRAELIAVQVAILLGQVVVCPDKIFRLEERAAGELLGVERQRRQMIAIADENGRLIAHGKPVHKRAEEAVHLMQLPKIILISVSLRFIFDARHANDRRALNGFGRIFSVQLHGNGVNKIRSFCAVERGKNFAREHGVVRPADNIARDVAHILNRFEGVEAEGTVNDVAVIERAGIVVHGVRGVAQFLEVEGHAFARFLQQDRLERIFARAEVFQVHARKHFKFRIGRAVSDAGNGQQSRRAARFQRGEDRNRVRFIRQPVDIVRIEERFKLQENDVRLYFRLRCALLRKRREDLFHALLGIGFRLIDSAINHAPKQAETEAVLVVRFVDVGKVARQSAGGQEDGAVGGDQNGGTKRLHQRLTAEALFFRRFAP